MPYPDWTHFTVDVPVSMLMLDYMILQNFRWISLEKWHLQHLAIEMMMNVYQILLANTSPNNHYILGKCDAYLSQEKTMHKSIKFYSNATFSGVLRGCTSSHVEEPVSLYYTNVSWRQLPSKFKMYPHISSPKLSSISFDNEKLWD